VSVKLGDFDTGMDGIIVVVGTSVGALVGTHEGRKEGTRVGHFVGAAP